MTSKHTPGPWIAKGEDGKYNHSRNTWDVDDQHACCSESAPITLPDGTIVAFAVASDDDYFTDDRTGANARLIAAAPSMLHTLVECERVLARLDTLRHLDPQWPILDEVRAQIAKATGEAA